MSRHADRAAHLMARISADGRTLHRHGYAPVPRTDTSKGIYVTDWPRFGITRPTPEQIEAWCRDGVPIGRTLRRPRPVGWGVVTGSALAVDIDVTDPKLAADARWVVEFHLGRPGGVRVGRAPKVLLLYRAAGAIPYQRREIPDPAGGRPHLIEVLGTGGHQFCASGPHPSGVPYTWAPGGGPFAVPLADLPPVGPEAVQEMLDELAPILEPARPPRAPEVPPGARTPPPYHGPPNGRTGRRAEGYALALLERIAAEIAATQRGGQEGALTFGAYRVGRFSWVLPPGTDPLARLTDAGLRMTNQPGRPRWRAKRVKTVVERALTRGRANRCELPAEPGRGRADHGG